MPLHYILIVYHLFGFIVLSTKYWTADLAVDQHPSLVDASLVDEIVLRLYKQPSMLADHHKLAFGSVFQKVKALTYSQSFLRHFRARESHMSCGSIDSRPQFRRLRAPCD